MPVYHYRALAADGQTISGEINATSTDELSNDLQNQGLLVQQITQKRNFSLPKFSSNKTIRAEQFLLFTQEFIALVSAGLTVTAALSLLKERDDQPRFADTLEHVLTDVQTGMSLSASCARHPDAFDSLFVMSLKTGERSGDIAEPLKKYQIQLQEKIALQRKFIQAMAYPLLLLVTLVVIVSVLFMFVMPRFISMYSGLGADLPKPTQILLDFTQSLPVYAPFLVLFAVSVFLLFHTWRSTKAGKLKIDYFKTKLPFVGEFIALQTKANITRTLSTLLASGMSLVEAIGATIDVTNNQWYRDKLHKVQSKVTEGESFAECLRNQKVLPNAGLKMIEAGEVSGKLSEILQHVTVFFEESLKYKLDRMTTLMEPLMMLLIGIFVGGTIIVLYLPIFSIAAIVQ